MPLCRIGQEGLHQAQHKPVTKAGLKSDVRTVAMGILGCCFVKGNSLNALLHLCSVRNKGMCARVNDSSDSTDNLHAGCLHRRTRIGPKLNNDQSAPQL